MKDMMMEIYTVLKANPMIAEKVGAKQIKFYEASEQLDYGKPFIVIDTLGPPVDAYHGSNKVLSQQFSYQINVESPNRLLTKELAKAVKEVMNQNKFTQLKGGLDEYFNETKRFVDARRYRKHTQIYDTEY